MTQRAGLVHLKHGKERRWWIQGCRSVMPLALISLLFIVTATAAYTAERELSLQEAIKIALEENREMRALKNSLSAHKSDIGIARSSLLPRIGFEERATRTNNPPGVFSMKLNQERFSQTDFDIGRLNSPSPISDFQTLLSFDQPLFAMNSFMGLSMAKKEYSARTEEYQRKKEEITFKVAQAGLRLRTARLFGDLTGKGVEDAREHLRIAEVRYRNGLGQLSDVLRAKTALSEAEQRQVTADKDISLSKRWLGLLLGTTEPVEIDGAGLDIPLKDADYYAAASLARRDVKAMEMRYQTAKDGVKRADSLYLPTIGVGGTYQFNDHERVFGSEGESWRLMAVLRWDLFDGMNREFERKKANDKAAEAAEHLAGLKQLVSFRIHEALLGIEEAKKNTELAKSSLASADEGRKLVKARYENSLSPMVDLLDVQLNLDKARAGLAAKENEYRAAILRLSFEGGTILKDLGVE